MGDYIAENTEPGPGPLLDLDEANLLEMWGNLGTEGMTVPVLKYKSLQRAKADAMCLTWLFSPEIQGQLHHWLRNRGGNTREVELSVTPWQDLEFTKCRRVGFLCPSVELRMKSMFIINLPSEFLPNQECNVRGSNHKPLDFYLLAIEPRNSIDHLPCRNVGS